MAAPTPEQYSRVSYLYDTLTPKPTELLNRGRYYIREGPLLVWDENRRKKSKRYIFLLNDALLIAKPNGRTKFFLRVFINLRSSSVSVEDMTSGFDHAFRLAVKSRSFVFFSDNSVDSWVSDVERAIRGNYGTENAVESKPATDFGGGLSKGSKSSTAGSRRGKQDFNSFTDGDFVETKVTFDSGVKLGGIRSTSDDSGAVPILAPPPARRNSGVGMSPPRLAAPTSANAAPAPVAANTTPSLEDFLGLSRAPATTSAAPASATAANPANAHSAATMDFWGAPAQPTTQNSQFSPFAASAQTAPAPANNGYTQTPFGAAPATANPSVGLQAAYYGNPAPAPQNANFNPFATPANNASPFGYSAPQTYGTAPNGYGANPQPGYYAGTQPAPSNDPFAMFAASPQPQNKTAKPVDFF